MAQKVPMPLDISKPNILATSESYHARGIARVFSNFYYRVLHNAEWGLYPKEYNKKIHGHYYPWRYYGKPDTPFEDVKIGELGKWIARRNKSPVAMLGAFRRWQHRLWNRWMNPRNMNLSLAWQFAAFYTVFAYCLRYKQQLECGPRYRYHN